MEWNLPLKVTIASFSVLALVFVFVGILSIGGAVFSDKIADPPRLVLEIEDDSVLGDSASAIPDDAEVALGFQTDGLNAAAPRIVWSLSTALIYFGVAGLITLVALAIYRLTSNPFFSSPIEVLFNVSSIYGAVIATGFLIRTFSLGWVAGAYDTTEFTGVEASIQTVELLAPLIVALFFVGGHSIWRQGRALQAESDQTI